MKHALRWASALFTWGCDGHRSQHIAGSIETTLPQRDEARAEQHVPKILILCHPSFNIQCHSTDTRKKKEQETKYLLVCIKSHEGIASTPLSTLPLRRSQERGTPLEVLARHLVRVPFHSKASGAYPRTFLSVPFPLPLFLFLFLSTRPPFVLLPPTTTGLISVLLLLSRTG